MNKIKIIKQNNFNLRLNGNTCVLVDWANVYGWTGELKRKPDERKIIRYLKNYKQVKDIRFYFGKDKTEQSKKFLSKIEKLGCKLISKEVKYVKVFDDNCKNFILKRKCDFDLEIGLDVLEMIDNYDSFVFFSGDGDYETLYQRLIKKNKQVIVVYVKNRLGREIWAMKKGLFKVELPRLGILTKNVPRLTSRARLK
jgi:uncharacterized LabA/DUF88 family protein